MHPGELFPIPLPLWLWRESRPRVRYAGPLLPFIQQGDELRMN